MNAVFVDKRAAHVSVRNTHILIDERKIPLRLVDTVVLTGKYTLNSKEILRLVENDVDLVLVSDNLSETAMVVSANGKNAELKMRQYEAARKPLDLAKTILTQKIETHNIHLRSLGFDSIDKREQIARAESLDELLGIEGSYSKYYFSRYFTLFPKKLAKGTRSKRPPKDPVNAMLSFTYTLFYRFVTIRLLGFGFEPAIGFLHRPFRTHHALSSDVMEYHRAEINRFVYDMFQDTLTINDFTKKKGVYLKYTSRSKFWKAYGQFVDMQQPRIDRTIADIRAKL